MVRLYFSLHDDDDDESQSSGLCLCSLSMCMLRVLLCQQKSLFSLALSIGLRVCVRASSVSIHNVLWVMHAHRVKYDTIHGLLGCCCVRVFLFLIWLLLLRLHPHQCQTKMRSMLAHEFHLHSMCCTMSYPPWVLHCSLARMCAVPLPLPSPPKQPKWSREGGEAVAAMYWNENMNTTEFPCATESRAMCKPTTAE